MASFQSGLDAISQTLDATLVSPERRRQLSTGDTDFIVPPTYFFELILPPAIFGWPGGSYLFPLQIAPQSVGISEPFAIEVTPTQNGGLFVEEQGVVQRRIRIRGNTGFWPTPLDIRPPQFVGPPQGRSFGRMLPPVNDLPLSGQRHFQWLQDSVFRLYGDLKRDPSTALSTKLVFHDPQSGEHWLVAPLSFGGERSSSQPLIYPYEIELLVLDKAQANPAADPSPDTSLLASIKNAYGSAQNFLIRATAAVQDLSAVQADLSRTVHGVGATIGQVNSLIAAVSSFVAGTVELIQAPYQSLSAIEMACESACTIAANARRLGAALYAWPRPVEQRFRALTTACEQLALSPPNFVRPASALQAQGKVAVAVPGTDTTPNFSSFASLRGLGSSPLPSDAVLQGAQTQLGAGTPTYPGTFEYRVQQGDTLAGLAARFLGSARLWGSIAAANAFAPPVAAGQVASSVTTDDRPAGAVLTVGQLIGIPAQTALDPQSPGVQVVGCPPDATAEEQAFGTDFALFEREDGQMDIAEGLTDGLPDVGALGGIDNVTQGLSTRLRVERGTATMYPSLGLQSVVGTSQADADAAALRLRVTQTLLDDPRTQSVSALSVFQSGDIFEISADVHLRGTGRSVQLNTQIRGAA